MSEQLYRLDLNHDYFRWTAGLPEWLVPDDTLQAIADALAELRKQHCYEDDDCVFNDTNGVGVSVDMTDFWRRVDAALGGTDE